MTTLLDQLEGDAESGSLLLIRHSVAELRKLCGRKDYTRALWRYKKGDASKRRKKYIIMKRKGHLIYFTWEPFQCSRVRGMSMAIPIGQFLREFEPVESRFTKRIR